jgi:hypothetical protein
MHIFAARHRWPLPPTFTSGSPVTSAHEIPRTLVSWDLIMRINGIRKADRTTLHFVLKPTSTCYGDDLCIQRSPDGPNHPARNDVSSVLVMYVLHTLVPLLCSVLLCSTLLYSTLLYSTLLYSTLLYSTLLYSALLYSTLLRLVTCKTKKESFC